MTLYNPFARYGRSQGWSAAHRAIDFGTPFGTRCGAPEDGVYYRLPDQLSRTNPTHAGRWGELRFPNGNAIRFCHLESHLVRSGTKVLKGQLIIATGNSGFVKPSPIITGDPRSGSHMHTYGVRPDGSRFDWTAGAEAICTGVVNTRNGLKLRARATTLSSTLAVLPYGTKVTLLGISGVWWQVKYAGKLGWVHSAYLN